MSDDGTEEAVEAGYTIGWLDIVLFVGFVIAFGGVVFSRFFRKKPSEDRSLSLTAAAIGVPAESNISMSIATSFLEKMKIQKKKVVVFYGSQTGTAEGFAGRLAKDARSFGLPSMVYDPEDCVDWDDLKGVADIEGSLVIFCLATYGEGDPTDNATEMYNWLKDDTSPPDLTGLRYTVFGLGNKTYEHYNIFGRNVDKILEECGAVRVCERGEGDDDGNIEEDFVTWKEKLWPTVCNYFGLDMNAIGSAGRDYDLVLHDDISMDEVYTGEPHKLHTYKQQKKPFNTKNPFLAPIRVNRELHKGGDRSCMHIEMDITGSSIRYTAGDHVAIYPENDVGLVDRIEELLEVNLDQVFSLVNKDDQATKKHPFPCPTTYRHALLHYVDITSLVRTNVLKELSEYCSDEKDKQHLNKITAPTDEGKQAYAEWIVKDHRHIVAVLEDLPSLKPPIDHLLELLPRLQVRYYSISSSQRMHASSIHITAVLVDYTTRIGRNVKGVATSWLKKKIPSNGDDAPVVPIYVRKSTLRLPYRPKCPVIMVGPGTGLAPFRGFIEDRCVTKNEGKMLGNTTLFFGCRYRSQDFLYEDELSQYEKDEVLTKLFVAFSRDQAEKVYVHHQMRENSEYLFNLLHNEKGYLYVCGDARNMARDVLSALTSILQAQGNMDEAQAASYIKKLQNENRFLQDVWS